MARGKSFGDDDVVAAATIDRLVRHAEIAAHKDDRDRRWRTGATSSVTGILLVEGDHPPRLVSTWLDFPPAPLRHRS